MTDIDLKTLTPDTSLPTTGFLFGADSQASTNPSVYSTQTVATTLLGSTVLTGGPALTADAPVLNLTQQWNNNAVTFTGIKFNVTDTLSASGSYLLDLQIGSLTKFYVSKSGAMVAGASITSLNSSGAAVLQLAPSPTYGYHMAKDYSVTWGSAVSLDGSIDLSLTRKAAANLRFGAADAAAPVAQTLSVQSVVAGTSSTAGADFTLTGSQNTGSGLAGNLIVSTGFSNTIGTATVTITIATPGVITWTAHGLVTGSPVVFTTTGALPTGITAGTTYFAITSSTLGVNTFQIATSAANAAAGTAITTSGTQSGVQTATTSATVQSPLMTTTTFGPSGLTGSQTTPVLNLAQTWNTSGNATGLKLNVTNTASGSSSYLMDIQLGGTSRFTVDKTGALIVKPNLGYSVSTPFMTFTNPNSGSLILYPGAPDGAVGFSVGGTTRFFIGGGTGSGVEIPYTQNIAFVNPGTATYSTILQDATSPQALAIRNGVNAQTFRLYLSYTDTSNYTRLALKTATGVHTLETESAGTGEANIDLALTPKGTGRVRYGTHAAVVAEVVTGYIEVKDAGGTVRKLAVIS